MSLPPHCTRYAKAGLSILILLMILGIANTEVVFGRPSPQDDGYSLRIVTQKETYLAGETITFRITGWQRSVEYWVEDETGKILKARRSTSTTTPKQFTPKVQVPEQRFSIRATANGKDAEQKVLVRNPDATVITAIVPVGNTTLKSTAHQNTSKIKKEINSTTIIIPNKSILLALQELKMQQPVEQHAATHERIMFNETEQNDSITLSKQEFQNRNPQQQTYTSASATAYQLGEWMLMLLLLGSGIWVVITSCWQSKSIYSSKVINKIHEVHKANCSNVVASFSNPQRMLGGRRSVHRNTDRGRLLLSKLPPTSSKRWRPRNNS
ncbi:hypothetical protein HZB02_02440 [Candidatus Woesearchaeota archaeon]|nr:hypothetical protein [Candidatus Woesearchaeota archaeon]